MTPSASADPSESSPHALRVAVIGAGAAAEAIHLPALRRTPGVTIVAIVDPAVDRAARLARAFDVPLVFASHREAAPHADAAVVGVPPYLHARIGAELLAGGVHVLMEKPMAPTLAECDALIEAADRSGAMLAIGMLRRFAPALRWTREALAAGLVGDVRSIDIEEGVVWRWPITSAAMLDPRNGGVLADIGSHLIDLLQWWFGECRPVRYHDDAMGGVEADAVIELETGGGVPVRVELSRSRDLRNRCLIRGERGTIEVGTKSDATVTVVPARGTAALAGRAAFAQEPPPASLADLFAAQMADFVRAVRTDRVPCVGGREGRRTIDVIDACYRRREPLVFPFETLLLAPAAHPR